MSHSQVGYTWQFRAENAWSQAQDSEALTRRCHWTAAAILAKRVAVRLPIDEYTVTKLRAAYGMYLFIRATRPQEARRLRRKYSYRRFYELFNLWRLWEFDADACIDHLDSELSNAGMAMQVKDAHDPRPEWIRKATGVLKWVEVIQTSDAPEEVRTAAKVFSDIVKKFS